MVARIFALVVLIFPLFTCASEAGTADREIIGLWKTVTGEINNRPSIGPSSTAEMEFRSDGELVFTLVDPPNEIISPVQMHGTYEVTKKNIVIYTIDGKTYERQSFTIKGDSLYMEDIEYKTKFELVRIGSSTFTEKPQIIK